MNPFRDWGAQTSSRAALQAAPAMAAYAPGAEGLSQALLSPTNGGDAALVVTVLVTRPRHPARASELRPDGLLGFLKLRRIEGRTKRIKMP
jgi:hypothetical protein